MSPSSLLAIPGTLGVLAATILISILGFRSRTFLEGLLLDVGDILKGRGLYRAVTSGFVHADPMHLFFNMLTLLFLGSPLERIVGTTSFLMIYFVSMIAGSAWAVLEHARSRHYRALGASGAVSGVIIAVALFMPYAWLTFPLPMPLLAYALIYIGWSAFAMRNVRDGIGHEAHFGGALCGLVLVCVFWPDAPRALWSDFLGVFRIA